MYVQVNWVNLVRFTHTVCLILVIVQELAYISLNILVTLNNCMVRMWDIDQFFPFIYVYFGCPTYVFNINAFL